ncbi:hypothetical protein [Pseudonocardia sp.]|uniref:hypothetical protein n=1 Tax=Pseudonocardia sp. TaxID=60912 RepID=UPI002623E682|nr:hypothetical protein [Pseudonocardia sp.]
MGTPHDRDTQQLQSDRGLLRWKVLAGVTSLALLVGLFVTSLVRVPNPAFTVFAAVTTVLLVSAMTWGLYRSRRR